MTEQTKSSVDLGYLAARVEAAPGPDRDIDGWIWAWLKRGDPYVIGSEPGRFPQKPIYGERSEIMELNGGKDGADYIGAPEFTASLDTAMTLVPYCPQSGGGLYAVRLDSGFYGATAELWHECSTDRFHGHASGQHDALPRALLAACLRALSQSDTDLTRVKGE